MHPNFIQSVIAAIAIGWLAAMALIIVVGLLTGSISTSGLLSTKTGGDSRHSPERVQLLLATIATAAIYLGTLAQHIDPKRLPEIESRWLIAAGASNAVYLATKVGRLIQKKFFPPSPST